MSKVPVDFGHRTVGKSEWKRSSRQLLFFDPKKKCSFSFYVWKQQKRTVERHKLLKDIHWKLPLLKYRVHLVTPQLSNLLYRRCLLCGCIPTLASLKLVLNLPPKLISHSPTEPFYLLKVFCTNKKRGFSFLLFQYYFLALNPGQLYGCKTRALTQGSTFRRASGLMLRRHHLEVLSNCACELALCQSMGHWSLSSCTVPPPTTSLPPWDGFLVPLNSTSLSLPHSHLHPQQGPGHGPERAEVKRVPCRNLGHGKVEAS